MERKLISFQELGLSEAMLRALENKGYGYPTTIQQEAIPPFMEWKDVTIYLPIRATAEEEASVVSR